MSELSAWDIDGTMRPGSLLAEAVLFGIEQGFIDADRFSDPSLPTYGEVDYFVEAITQRSRRDFKNLTDKITEDAANSLFPWVAERLEGQAHPLLISHSPDFLVKAFGKGIDIAHARGSYFHTKELAFSGHAVTLDKARALRRYMANQGITCLAFAAGDSLADLPLLTRAEHSVVVNPEQELAQIALRHGWEVVSTHE